MKFRQKKVRKGFTLIELIVVIAIISILSAISVPRVIKYIEDAKEVTNVVTADDVYIALVAFIATNPDFHTNYKEYTVQDTFDYGKGLVYVKPECVEAYLSNVDVTSDEMASLRENEVRIEYSAVNNKKDYNFEIQIGGSEADRRAGKEYSIFNYEKKK